MYQLTFSTLLEKQGKETIISALGNTQKAEFNT